MTSITFICFSFLFFTRILRLSFMGVVAINVLKEVCKEYSDEIEMQEASITEILVLQEQVKMELLSNKNPTNFWPDATLPVGWQW